MVKEGVPYSEESLGKNLYLRTFSETTEDSELKWHWDPEDRVIYPQHPTDWMIQRDNSLPENLSSAIQISAGEWHRLIKGTGDLKLKIYKAKKDI